MIHTTLMLMSYQKFSVRDKFPPRTMRSLDLNIETEKNIRNI